MPSRREKIGAGVFLLTAVLLTLGTVVVIAGVTLGRRVLVYDIRFSDSVHGLTSGSDVVYLGVHVGKVREVRPEVGAVLATVEVFRGTPIKTGTFAILDTNLLTGTTHIELRGGKPEEAEPIEGSEIRWEKATMSAVQDSLPGAVDGLAEIVLRLQDLLRPENRALVASILETADREFPATAQSLRAALDEWRTLPATIRDLGDKLESQWSGMREPLDLAILDFREAAREIADTARTLRQIGVQLDASVATLPQSLAELNDVLARMSSTLQTVEMQVSERGIEAGENLAALRRSTRSLETLLADLKENPWLMLRGAPAAETGPPEQ